MSDDRAQSRNVAADSSQVGVQAEAVHGDIHISYLPKDDSPEEQFRSGLRYLSSGMAQQARQYLSDAVAGGLTDSRVRFYLVLALLSGRTLQSLTPEDMNILREAGSTPVAVSDEWTEAIETINRLCKAARDGDVDPRLTIKEFDALAEKPRRHAREHLEMFWTGALNDWYWKTATDEALDKRFARDRLGRVWRFFQPRPAPPRVREPEKPVVSTSDWARVALGVPAAAASTFHLGSLANSTSPVLALAGWTLLIFGVYLWTHYGWEWRLLHQLGRAKESAHRSPTPRSPSSRWGTFAREVDAAFVHYFHRYAPQGPDRRRWLDDTAGIRETLRKEVTELYRESLTEAARVKWLIRFMVFEVKGQWLNQTLFDYRERLRPSLRTQLMAVVGAALVILGGITFGVQALQADVLTATISLGVGIVAWFCGAVGCTRTALDHRRYVAACKETAEQRRRRLAAYARWRKRLAKKPNDFEMASWLDCDRKALIHEAMRHYKLEPRDVIAHASLEAPADLYKRARVRGGPWRYSRYDLLIFLLTNDGVRLFRVDLDFERGTYHDRVRMNFRYDAVAAVEVREADDGHRIFKLTLLDGQPLDLAVTGPATSEVQQNASILTLDAAGLPNTLHILEGIAAEGKHWIPREKQREKVNLDNLSEAVRGLID